MGRARQARHAMYEAHPSGLNDKRMEGSISRGGKPVYGFSPSAHPAFHVEREVIGLQTQGNLRVEHPGNRLRRLSKGYKDGISIYIAAAPVYQRQLS